MRATPIALLLVASVVLAGCKARPAPTTHEASVPPSSEGHQLCAGPRDEAPLRQALEVAHEARAAEVRGLLRGSSTRVVVYPEDDKQQAVEEVTSYPPCAPSTDAVLRDRIARAERAFHASKEMREHQDRRGSAGISVGCDEGGVVPVSLGIGIGIGEAVQLTYLVSERSANLVVRGAAMAHADLDGDGRRDLVWVADGGVVTPGGTFPGRRVVLRFASTGREQAVPLEWVSPEDSESSFGTAPALKSAFALLRVAHGSGGNEGIAARLRWSGKSFVPVERLPDDGFEDRVAEARERMLAVDGDAISGTFGRLLLGSTPCGDCRPLVERAVPMLAHGGIPEKEGRRLLLAYLGLQTCP